MTNQREECIQARLTIDIRSYWLSSGGRGLGLYLNSQVVTDAEGLPFLPGRQIKGLLRDAVGLLEHWGHIDKGSQEILFGQRERREFPDGKTRHERAPGLLSVGNAQLPETLQNWLGHKDNRAYLQGMCHHLYSTSIDHETGAAKKGSLRGFQVVVPATLTAMIQENDTPLLDDWFDEKDLNRLRGQWYPIIEKTLPLVRAVGGKRTRGLGRSVLKLEKTS
ncbi:RAMP superfamily CRISPR-associated protein [Magnetococcales bacterium HHB-1]